MPETGSPGERSYTAAEEILRIAADERYDYQLKRWMIACRVEQEVVYASPAR